MAKKKKKKVIKKTRKLSDAQVNKAIEQLIDIPLFNSYRVTAEHVKQIMVYKAQVGEIMGHPIQIEILIDGRK